VGGRHLSRANLHKCTHVWQIKLGDPGYKLNIRTKKIQKKKKKSLVNFVHIAVLFFLRCRSISRSKRRYLAVDKWLDATPTWPHLSVEASVSVDASPMPREDDSHKFKHFSSKNGNCNDKTLKQDKSVVDGRISSSFPNLYSMRLKTVCHEQRISYTNMLQISCTNATAT
jgi:hypothetical protein